MALVTFYKKFYRNWSVNPIMWQLYVCRQKLCNGTHVQRTQNCDDVVNKIERMNERDQNDITTNYEEAG